MYQYCTVGPHQSLIWVRTVRTVRTESASLAFHLSARACGVIRRGEFAEHYSTVSRDGISYSLTSLYITVSAERGRTRQDIGWNGTIPLPEGLCLISTTDNTVLSPSRRGGEAVGYRFASHRIALHCFARPSKDTEAQRTIHTATRCVSTVYPRNPKARYGTVSPRSKVYPPTLFGRIDHQRSATADLWGGGLDTLAAACALWGRASVSASMGGTSEDGSQPVCELACVWRA